MNQFLTAEELQQLKDLREKAVATASTLGELSYQKILIDLELEKAKQQVIDIKDEEAKIFSEVGAKYGDVTVNLETGEVSTRL
jgi:hypothetical protein